MKLSQALEGLGRTVAYHPGLVRVTGSATSALLLCQLWWWQNRNKEGFFKSALELEEATGLTRAEQETARAHLRKKGILEERRVRRGLEFRLNIATIDALWETSVIRKSTNHVIRKSTNHVIRKSTNHDSEIDQSQPVVSSSLELKELKKEKNLEAAAIVKIYVDQHRLAFGADPTDKGRMGSEAKRALAGDWSFDAVGRAAERCARDPFGAAALPKHLKLMATERPGASPERRRAAAAGLGATYARIADMTRLEASETLARDFGGDAERVGVALEQFDKTRSNLLDTNRAGSYPRPVREG